MNNQRIVFYRLRRDVEEIDGTILTSSNIEQVLREFEQGSIHTLKVSILNCTGWKVSVENIDAVDIEFINCDDRYFDAHRMQARGRIRIKTITEKRK